MAVWKTTLVLVVLAFVMASFVMEIEAVRVGPCDQVCSRIDPEKDECCRAHGHRGYSSCARGQMQCY